MKQNLAFGSFFYKNKRLNFLVVVFDIIILYKVDRLKINKAQNMYFSIKSELIGYKKKLV